MGFLPTTDSKFFPWTLEEALKMEATKEGEKAKDVMIGLNRDEGTLDLLLSGSTEFGPGVGKDDDLAVKIFDDFVRYALPEAKDPFVMDKIRHQYFYGRVRDIARLFANGFFDCDIAKTADALAKNGDRKVYRYLFDVEYRYVGNAYPYLGASHSLELQALWGRPYVETEIYTDEERSRRANDVLLGRVRQGIARFGGPIIDGPRRTCCRPSQRRWLHIRKIRHGKMSLFEMRSIIGRI